MFRRCTFSGLLLLALLTPWAFSQTQAPPENQPLRQPAQPVAPREKPPAEANPKPETSPETPSETPPAAPSEPQPAKTEQPPEPPLQFTPPPLPPPPAVEKKVQIDSRGRRVRPMANSARVDQKVTKKSDSSAPEEFKIRSHVELVLLDVSVKDSRGGFVSGLSKDDFKIYEDKVAQDITVFQAQDVPVTVGLIVDNSGSVRPKKAEIVTAALTFVKNSNPQDEIFIVNFNDRVRSGLPPGIDFTDDHALLRQGLLLNPAQGRTALYDGLNEALEHIEKGRLAKKTIVLIADGGDNMSDITEEEIFKRVRESLATIYTVGIFNPRDKDKNPGFLKHLAEISGGEYYRPKNISHLVGVCEKIAHDIRNRYTIGYSPKNLTFDGKVRKLKVLAKNPENGRELEVRTRSQYRTPALEEAAR